MKYSIKPTSKFQKDLKRIQKRGYDLSLLSDVIKKLSNGESLPLKYRDHNLIGNFCGCRECHITPDWLLDLRNLRKRPLSLSNQNWFPQ